MRHLASRRRFAPFLPLALLALALSLVAGGCSGLNVRVERPNIQTRRVEFVSVTDREITMRVELAVYNPNAFDLPIREVTAALALEGERVGSSQVRAQTTLAAMNSTTVFADVTLPWQSAPHAIGAAVARPTVRYSVDGVVAAQGPLVGVTANYAHSGEVSRDVLARSAADHVTGALGGLGGFVSSGGARW